LITLTANINSAFDTTKGLTWIVKLSLDDATRYWASEIVTISSQEYVGRFVLEDGLAEIDQSVDITLGGGLGSVGNTSLSLKEIITQNGLHRDFKPQSAGTELMNRTVDIGCVYNFGSLSTSDIVWLYKGVIDDSDYSIDGMNLDVVGIREIEQRNLPFQLINSTDYANAPAESIGQPMPILYAKSNAGQYAGDFALIIVPAILVNDKTNQYLFAGHNVITTTTVVPCIFENSLFWSLTYQSAWDAGTATPTLTIPSIGGSPCTFTYTSGSLYAEPLDPTNYPSGVIFPNRQGSLNTVTTYQNLVGKTQSSTSIANTKILSLIADNLPQGIIIGNITFYIGVAASSTFRFGYVDEDLTFDAPHTLGTYAAVVADQTVSSALFDKMDTSELASKELIINCGAVGESATIDFFYYLMYISTGNKNINRYLIDPRAKRSWDMLLYGRGIDKYDFTRNGGSGR